MPATIRKQLLVCSKYKIEDQSIPGIHGPSSDITSTAVITYVIKRDAFFTLFVIGLTVCSIRDLENWPPLNGPMGSALKTTLKLMNINQNNMLAIGAKADPN